MDVLLVGKEPGFLHTLSEELVVLGLSTVTTDSADQALRAAGEGEKPPAVLVTQAALEASVDGYSLAKELRQRWPEVSVVVLSGDQLYCVHLARRACACHRADPSVAGKVSGIVDFLVRSSVGCTADVRH